MTDFNQNKHPELQDGEEWLTNVVRPEHTQSTFGDCAMTEAIDQAIELLKSMTQKRSGVRLGKTAYGMDGKKSEGMVPVFAQKSK